MKKLICLLLLTGAIITFLSLFQSSRVQYGFVQEWVKDEKRNPLEAAVSETESLGTRQDSVRIKDSLVFTGSFNGYNSGLNTARPDPYLNILTGLFFRVYRKWSLYPKTTITNITCPAFYDFPVYNIKKERSI